MSENGITYYSKQYPKTNNTERGFDNQAFSNDDYAAENILKYDTRKHSILLQKKNIDVNHEKSPTAASGKSTEKDEQRETTEDPLSVHTERSADDKEGKREGKDKTNRNREIEGVNGAVATSKETDDIATMSTDGNSEEENSELEPTDMFYAIARSSIDMRYKGLSRYKVSKIRKTLILFSCFYMQMCLGLLFSLGILYVELLDAFKSGRSLTSLVQSLPLGLAYVLGLIVGSAIQKLGLRVSIFCGGILAATGFIVSSFMNNIYAIIILIGGVSGTGICFFNISTFASIPVYFGKKQRVAVAFTAFGTGAGAMLWPNIHSVLLKHFGWRGNVLITGGILLNACALSLFFIPLPKTKEQKEPKEEEKISLSMREKFLRLVKMPTFLAFLLWCIIDGFASPVIGQMVVDFSRENGYGRDQGRMLLVYFSAMNATGRATVGLISRFKIPSYTLFALASLLCGSAYIGIGFSTAYWEAAVIVAIAGSMLGAHVALMMIVLLKIVGSDLYGLAWGLVSTCLGIGFVISGPISGYISDHTEYKVAFYVFGMTMVADIIVHCIIITICKCMKKSKAVTP